jgi:hypothetical protein
MACEAELLDEISSEEIDVEAETKASALRLLGGRLRTGSVAFSFFGETSFRGFRRKRRGMQDTPWSARSYATTDRRRTLPERHSFGTGVAFLHLDGIKEFEWATMTRIGHCQIKT